MKVLVSRLARPRFGAVFAVAALTGATMIAAVAMAHNVAHSNSVTITRAGPIPTPPGRAFYKGQVVSPKHACEVAREVQAYALAKLPQPEPAMVVAGGGASEIADEDRKPWGIIEID